MRPDPRTAYREHVFAYQRGPWKHNYVTVIRKRPINAGENAMTTGLLIRRPSVRSRPSPLNGSKGLAHQTSSDSVGSDTSKNAAIQGSSHNPKHNSVTALVRQFEETVRVSKRDLLTAREELMEQVRAIDRALYTAGDTPELPRVFGSGPTQVSNTVLRVIAGKGLTAREVAEATGTKEEYVRTQLSRAVRLGKATYTRTRSERCGRYRLVGGDS